MFQLDKVTRRFGAQVLFQDLAWRIAPAARLGLVGPNGSGKTTLLRLLAGLDRPDSGAVLAPPTAHAGYLPQEVETVESGSVLSAVLAGFPEVGRIETQLEELELRLSGLRPGDPEARRLAARYGELRHRFEALEGDRLEARAKTILGGLGIETRRFHEPLERLSGGWRMRVVLARLLLRSPDLLLLDEPTNHLDLGAIQWLESFLGDYAGAFVVVSHDRYFLNRLVRGIVELEAGRLTEYAGNYDAHVEAKRRRQAQLDKRAKQQRRETAKTERFIERFRYKASKARQVQSRVRAMSKLERVPTASRARRLRFGFPPAPRSGDVVARAEGVVKRFDDTVVYDGLDLWLRRGDRVALVGPNGAGKSTLLKLLAGRLAADAGRLELGHNVRCHYYAQHQLDELDPEATVLEELERTAPAEQLPRLRTLLGRFLFHGKAVDKQVSVLSGGEKARLALARMLVRPANLLLLDEPTNHLDLPGREVLEEALNEYAGTLVVVSHDRYFINRVATSIGEVGSGRVELHAGDFDAYSDSRHRGGEPAPALPVPDPRAAARDLRRAEKRREAEERNRRYRQRRRVEERLEPLETEIAELERRVRELEGAQADPQVYRDPEEARRIGRSVADARERLDALYAEWEKLAERLRQRG